VISCAALLLRPDLAAAQVTLTAPSTGQTVSGSTPVSVSVSAGVSWVNFYIDGFAIAATPPYTTSWDTTVELNGTHFVEVRAYNGSGTLLASDTATVQVANATPASTPTPPGYFGTLPPKSALPSETSCSSAVLSQPSSEGIPANTSYNDTKPTADELATFHALPLWRADAPVADFRRVDGKFTATTDQIIRWAACKWGLDENALRAEAWYETNWIESNAGDRRTDYSLCHTPNWNGWDGSECWQSYGIFQAKVFDYNIWPEGRDSTAFNSDFRGAYLRACMNGHVHYLGHKGKPEPGYPTYTSADPNYKFWGCMGEWASGLWFDVGAIEYITFVRRTALAAAWPNAQLVKITQPPNGDTVSGAVGIVTQLSQSAAWENILIDGQYLGSSPPETFTWNSTGASNGEHTITANAFNSQGQRVGGDSIIVNTNQSADSLSITSPSQGSTVSGY
jgi:hypothetical protein